ncbi:MAG: hypothetical protein Q9169_003016 [Polycauliona sp. 2 TL-2023]
MFSPSLVGWLAVLPYLTNGLRWSPEHVGYNLNENREAIEPTDYWGEWENHTFHPSPSNWRFPFYVCTLDRFVDGDPTNNEANGTVFEHNWMTNQFRFGGDVKGLEQNLDYIQGLGIKASMGTYLTFCIWLMWCLIGYIPDGQSMGNLFSMEGYVNKSAEFSWQEHNFIWKSERRYHDFAPGNGFNASCEYPRMWGQDGYPVGPDILSQQNGCKDSEFDQGTGSYPAYQSQLSNFASVQDRLREWRSDVFDKIKIMSCIQIAMFDIDGFRMDKALQTTPDALAEFSAWQRQCARDHGKDNFLMVGEIVGDPKLASVYVGRGREPNMMEPNVTKALMATNMTNSSSYIREFGKGALDGAAFHYDIYGSMTRFLGLDSPWGAYGVDWVEQWTKLVSNNDMVNSETGVMDPRHMFGMTGQDVFRWPALANGTQRQLLGFFVTMLDSAYGCHDDSVSLDHRDPSHPMRNVLKRIFEMRRQYPTLNDGYNLITLSNKTYDIYLPGSEGLASETGLWSVYRGRTEGIQDLAGTGQGNQGVWLLFSNENQTVDYEFDCASSNRSEVLVSAFPAGTVVKNLFYPYQELTLEASKFTYGLEQSKEPNGCLSTLSMAPWDYKAFVPLAKWLTPAPTITRVVPGHDARLESSVGYAEPETVPIQIRFSSEMDCDIVAERLVIESRTEKDQIARLNKSSVSCMMTTTDFPRYIGEIATAFIFNADLINVFNGVHTYTVNNATTKDGLRFTNAVDRFMFRIGQSDNPMVFPLSSNYTGNLLHKDDRDGKLYISPRATGADKFRYSTNWGTSFSDWSDYSGGNVTVVSQPWSGTKDQEWEGEHIIVNYWSQMTGSSEHIQHADLNRGNLPLRRWPHAFVEGDWNQWGYDNGLPNGMTLQSDGIWELDLVAEWPAVSVVNVWGMNPDGYPDKSMALGDVNDDKVLDWVPPDSLATNVISFPRPWSWRYLGHRLLVNDGNFGYSYQSIGHTWVQIVLAVLLAFVPLVSGALCCIAFMKLFYKVKFNEKGITEKGGLLPYVRPKLPDREALRKSVMNLFSGSKVNVATPDGLSGALAAETGSPDRRTVLIATMEYEIEDWEVKIKIGGLGVMASLMGKNLGHQNLIWVVPCVGGVHYPIDRVAQPMDIIIFGKSYRIEVQYHTLRNITFVLLDAPVFRKQTKTEPYPPRMDDLDSAIYYSAWNSCIAQAIERFPIDLYHINDYHGAIAPLHLLPRTMCLSLHNAEFQGLWPIRTSEEFDEICGVYNLDEDIVQDYIQFGQVFNLLHAGASYLRKHQKGFGAVGVSKKYGKRSFARYPIFWGLSNVGSLPNPDPTDTGEWNKTLLQKEGVVIDTALEAERGELRIAAQRWAGLKVDPTAQLFVFVGRWSQQKGIDLIADVFFSILEEYPAVQLICVGPIIDLYGKFAAIKLEKMMEKYPGRVYSKPEFTALPPCIFSGAEFSLIPSRDEPFGLVAVEFGRKGALGVGSRVGGLGNMPGWWFTIESPTTKHLINQFKEAIHTALSTSTETRTMMRARSRLQRFPVAQWIEDLEILQNKSIRLHERVVHRQLNPLNPMRITESGRASPAFSTAPASIAPSSAQNSEPPSRATSPSREAVIPGSHGQMSLGRFFGPSHPSIVPRGRSRSASRSRSRSRHGLTRKRSNSSLATGHNNPVKNNRVSVVPEGNEELAVLAQNSPRLHATSLSESRFIEEESTQQDSPNEGFPRRFPPLEELDNQTFSPGPSGRNTPTLERQEIPRSDTPLSVHSVSREQKTFNLQRVDPFFTDNTETYYRAFQKKLESVNSKSAEDQLCIEEYLVKSERAWFNRFHQAKMGNSATASRASTPASSVFRMPWGRPSQDVGHRREDSEDPESPATDQSGTAQFFLGDDYKPPTGLKKILQTKIGDWHLYCFLLAFGQIIAANSYQITLLTGENGQSAHKLYIIASIYLGASVLWWLLFRLIQQVYLLSLPFLFYGLAFFLIGMAPYTADLGSRGWIYNVATAFYAAASASGSLFFALNFGTEGGTPAQSWAFRACVIQGSQQLYVAALWYWGASLTASSNEGVATSILLTSSRTVTAITTPIACLLWAIGLILLFGLPSYYRQTPGKIPSFYIALFRRKIVIWFFLAVIIQNYWLSAPYGRNWRYLWNSSHAPAWGIVILILIFFVGVWALMLFILGHFSKQHSWILPIFAIGLGAPRWAQMLWGISGIGTYVPFGSPAFGAILGRTLWCWISVLDSIQGVGFGMILLQTLTRYHVAFTLLFAQVVGSLATIASRASAPDAMGPGSVFPNLSLGVLMGLRHHWFWIGLFFQLVIPVGFFVFFRKAQLFKP